MPAENPETVAERAAPPVWVLHDGKPGMRSQALGLAEAAALPFREITLTISAPWRWLPPPLWLAPLAAATDDGCALLPPWPDMVIGCGRNAVRPALAVRRASGGRTRLVHIQDPRFGRDRFDLMIVPEHDRLRGRRVLLTKAALHRVTPQRLRSERRRFPALEELPRPIVGVLIGGSNRAYRLGMPQLAAIAEALAAMLHRTGGAAVVSVSRRTGGAGIPLLRERLAGRAAAIWDGSGENPYYAYMAIADALLVTPDSISMVSEAAATGKPVYILPLQGGDAKFARFHAMMTKLGITRPFVGEIARWSYTPPDDNARAAAALHALFGAPPAMRLAV